MDPVPTGGVIDAINLFQNSPATTSDKVNSLIWCLWANTFFSLYLYIRQLRNYMYYVDRIDPRVARYFSPEVFERSRQYDLDKENFDIVTKIIKTMVLTLLLWRGSFYQIWVYTEHFVSTIDRTGSNLNPRTADSIRSVYFAAILIMIYFVVKLPLNLYFTFVIEEDYGFNNQSFIFFATDLVKRFILANVVVLPIAYTLQDDNREESRHAPDVTKALTSLLLWCGSLFLGFVSIEVMYYVVDRVVLRWFLEYQSLTEGEMKERVDELAQRFDFPPDRITVINTSKWTKRSGCIFFGFILHKRIFLYDTLWKHADPSLDVTPDELIGIVAVQLGHWRRYHSAKKLIADNIYGAVTFWLFSYFWEREFTDSEFTEVVQLLPFMLRLMGSGGFYMNYLSVLFEFEADQFVVLECGKGEEWKMGLVKMYQQNLIFTVWDDLYSSWYHPTPNPIDRIEAMDKLMWEQRHPHRRRRHSYR